MDAPDRSADRWIVFGWLLTVPLALIEWVLLALVLPKVVRSPDMSKISSVFLPSVRGFRPEPLEQARYVVGITVAFLVYAAGALIFRRWIRTHRSPDPQTGRRLGAAAIVIQLSLCVAAVYLWISNAREPLAYFPWVFLAGALVVTVASLGALYIWGRREPRTLSRWTGRLLPRLLVFGLLVVGLLPSLFTAGNLLHAHWSIIYHTSFTLEDFAAIVAGRTPLVDFSPQYQNLLPLLAILYFRLFGLSVTSFSLLMTLLSAAELTLAYAILRQVTRSEWGSTLLFVPFAAIGFYPVPEVTPPLERYYSFNVYMQHPLRTFGPWVVAFLCARYLAKPSRKKMMALFVVGAFAAVNNVDFGLPAFIASLAAVLATADIGLLPSLENVRPILLRAFAAAVVALSVFMALCLVRSGSLPNFTRWLDVQRTYVFYGFGMLPMPAMGIYWIVFGTFLAAIALALLSLARDESGGPEVRDRYGMLLFGGIFGFGASMYYVGRSHPWSLIVIFSFWGFSLALLSWEAFSAWRGQETLGRLWLSLVPAALLVAHVSICLLAIVEINQPFGQIERLFIRSPVFSDRLAELDGFVKRHAAAGERVVISFPYGHLVGVTAGVDNVFPFGFAGELLTFGQVDQLVEAIQRNQVTRIFGELRSEEVQRLAALGFRRTDGLPASSLPVVGAPFQLWEREPALALGEPPPALPAPMATGLKSL